MTTDNQTDNPTTDNPETSTRPPLMVSVWYDYDTESPAEYDIFRLISFNRDHRDHGDAYDYLACQFANPAAWNVWADLTETERAEIRDFGTFPARDLEDSTGEYVDSDLMGELLSLARTGDPGPDPTESNWGEPCDGFHPDSREVDGFAPHDWQPANGRPLAILSYYEHGLCQWSRSGHGPADYGGFDTVDIAGVLVWNDPQTSNFNPATDPDWFDGLSDYQQKWIIDGFLDTFTAWANGECYGFTVERSAGVCECCGQTRPPILVDSCGGYIGDDIFPEIVSVIGAELGKTIDDLDPGDFDLDPSTSRDFGMDSDWLLELARRQLAKYDRDRAAWGDISPRG